MVTTGVARGTGEDPRTSRLTRLASAVRVRAAALPRSATAWIMLGLVVVSLLQRPGRTTFDTKLDLTVDPAEFLRRAMHLWNPEATAGELQNQAYGYLFPTGPYFVAMHTLGVPAWISQRLWSALLLCVAFGGMLALARAMRIGTDPARYAGALAYALAPRMVTEIGALTVEILPVVMLPWVMLPLVRASLIGSPRRAAGLSALAVLAMGGINAATVVAALVLPTLWLLTRQWTREHVRLVLWWAAMVLAATLWWVLPLLLLGQYSPPFLDYIEAASHTTSPMSLFQVLRGTNQWVAYVVAGTPWWPAGLMLIDNPVLMLASGLVATVGVAGLVRARLPERRFLVLGVVTGLTLLTVGYVGALDSPLSGMVRAALDGPLAPLRNVHKFEPVLRLPLALAFTYAVSGALPWLRGRISTVRASRIRLAAGFLVVLVMAAPAWLFTLRPGPGWDDMPGYWRSAMTWLGEADGSARTLLLPATGFGQYSWGGRTVDEPAQPLARAPWAVRSQIPLGTQGHTRVMDTVEDVLVSGRGSPALADFLARAGYQFLLLRNDIDRTGTGLPPIATLRAALADSPGITRVTTFGPDVAAGAPAMLSPLDQRPVPALEIYQVRGPVPAATAVAASDTLTVSGGPESLLGLLESGMVHRDEPAVLAGDGGAPQGARWLVTDGLRHRERNYGRVHDTVSHTLAADEPLRQLRPAADVLPFPGMAHQTVAAYRGIRAVTASSSVSFADAFGATDPSRLPFAAVDGDPGTAWHSSSGSGPSGQWLEIELDTPRMVTELRLRMVDDLRVGWPVTRIQVTTDAGSVDADLARGEDEQNIATVPGLTSTVRVTVRAVAANRQDGNAGIRELSVPGVLADRALRVPRDAGTATAQPAGYAFTRGWVPRYACVEDRQEQRCEATLARSGEEPGGLHRLFPTAEPARFQVSGTVLPAVGGRNPVSVAGLEVAGSSQLAGDPATGPLAAVDGDPGTTWRPDPADLRPTLRLAWPRPMTITGLRLTVADASGTAPPSMIAITTTSGERSITLDGSGAVNLSATTDRLEIALVGKPGRTNLDVAPRLWGVSELSVTGPEGPLLAAVPADAPFTVACGNGPPIAVDGTTYATSVSGTLADITHHRPVPLVACDELGEGLDLDAGEHELRTTRSESFVVQDLWLRRVGTDRAEPARRAVTVRQWDTTRRTLEVGPGPSALLRVAENANDGWVARVDGRPLEPTRVDGWQQAWLLPAGESVTVRLEFVPDADYRTRLLVGAVAAVVLIVVTALPVRRRRDGTGLERPSGQRWVPVALVVLLAALGGMLPIVLLIACLLLRLLWPPSTRVLAIGGMVAATGVAVAGRVLGHGQQWAHSTTAQALLMVVVVAVVSLCVPWFGATDRSPDAPGDLGPERAPG